MRLPIKGRDIRGSEHTLTTGQNNFAEMFSARHYVKRNSECDAVKKNKNKTKQKKQKTFHLQEVARAFFPQNYY